MEVNEKGFVNNSSVCQHAYSFVHLNNAPFFSHLDNQSMVQFKENYFIKTYSLNDISIESKQSVLIQDSCIYWDIDLLDNDKYYSFGITIQIDDVIPKDVNSNPIARMSHYADINAKRWKEQTELKYPVIYVYISGTPVSICTNPNCTSNYFWFKEKDQQYIKISQTGKFPKMQLRLLEGHTDKYKDIFKNNKHFLSFASVVNNKIKHYYGANVELSDQCYLNIKTTKPTEVEANEHLELLWNELLIYPKNIFQILNVKDLFLFTSNSELNAFFDGNIHLNTNNAISDSQKIIAFHHEMFHAIEKKYNLPLDDSLSSIFGWMIYDKNYVDYMKESNCIFRDKYKKIQSILLSLDESFLELINKSKNYSDNFSTRDISYKSREKSIEIASRLEKIKINDLKEVKPTNDIFYFQGMKGCGASFVNQIFNTNKTGDIIYVVRNPIELCAKNKIELSIDIQETYQEWLKYYSKVMNDSYSFIRYEDVVVYNKKKIQKTISKWTNEFPSEWTQKVDVDKAKYNIESIVGLNLIYLEFINTKYAWYYEYEKTPFRT